MAVRKILVVEDDESLRRVMQVQLEKAGHKTAVAADAGQALEVLNHDAQDVVITDLNLPGMSGLELLKRVRTEHPETVTIVVTAYGTVTSAVDAMKAGAYDYVMKPVHSTSSRYWSIVSSRINGWWRKSKFSEAAST